MLVKRGDAEQTMSNTTVNVSPRPKVSGLWFLMISELDGSKKVVLLVAQKSEATGPVPRTNLTTAECILTGPSSV